MQAFTLTLAACCRPLLLLTLAPPALAAGMLEAGGGHAALSGAYGDWDDQYLRGNLRLDDGPLLSGELSQQRHFGERGTFAGVGVSHDFDPQWFGMLSAGGSSGGSFLPRLRLDGTLARKWLAQGQLVTSVGAGYFQSRVGYTDRSLSLGASYYFAAPWLLEGGLRLNRSSRGQVDSRRAFAALTYGREGQHYLTVRHEAGNEAYQAAGSSGLLVDFASRDSSVSWRQWLAPHYGFRLQANYYVNPSYHRAELQLGAFVTF